MNARARTAMDGRSTKKKLRKSKPLHAIARAEKKNKNLLVGSSHEVECSCGHR